MITLTQIYPNLYKDSVALMRVAQSLLAMPGVSRATLQMGTQANKAILAEAGLLTDSASAATPGDAMVVVVAADEAQAQDAMRAAGTQLVGSGAQVTQVGAETQGVARTVAMAQKRMTGASVVQISVPGAYAAAEALKAIKAGLHVFMFSDNVSVEQEIALKQEARERGLLVMGPDCGTAIIAGAGFGFVNAVRRGNIGVVAASGTGLQEVSTQIHRMGAGISHAIGTGGRDVYAQVGAITMLHAIALLASDAATHVIALVSKPADREVLRKVYAALGSAGKPAVVLFLGAEESPVPVAPAAAPLTVVHTLVDCAAVAVALARQKAEVLGTDARPQVRRAGAAARPSVRQRAAPGSLASDVSDHYPIPSRPRFAPTQRFIRALYAGGTYCAEAQILWSRAGLKVHSNTPVRATDRLSGPGVQSEGHTALDMGDDAFTLGRPHPMIDQAARIARLLEEARDATVAVLVLDVVLGWGAHANPAGQLGEAIVQARQLAGRDGRHLAVVGFVCGTDADRQNLRAQERALRSAGMVLAPNSASAAWLAREWVR